MLKRHIVFNVRKKKFNVKFNYKILVFFTLMLCGCILGAHISGNIPLQIQELIKDAIKASVSSFNNENIFITFLKLFLPFFVLLLVSYITGLCGVGIPLLCTVPLFTGSILSFVVSQFRLYYGWSGIGFCALVYLPVYATATATLIKSCCCSFDISSEIFIFLATSKRDGGTLLKEHSLKHIVLMLPILISASLSVLLYNLFGDLFSFIT